MKKIMISLFIILLVLSPICFADSFDTNTISFYYSSGGGEIIPATDYNPYWFFSERTGTRYIFRIYDRNTNKYIAVPQEYYINHTYASTSSKNEVMYLGADKTSDGKYDIVKSGKPIFTDTTYSHVIKWYDNASEVKRFGLTKNDINMLAEIIKNAAIKKGDISIVNSMQNVIEGKIPYEIRAEILFLMKMPGTKGTQRNITVYGNNSVEKYNFITYDNNSTNPSYWRRDYMTFREIKYYCYKINGDARLGNMKRQLDNIACALYERDQEYVFSNGVYQCSCDLYRLKYDENALYSLKNKELNVNAPAYLKSGSYKQSLYHYCLVGRCGIPVQISDKTYYVTPGMTYSNLAGSKTKVSTKVKYSDGSYNYPYNSNTLKVLSSDATTPTIYEGWDYITNNMPALSVIACDKDTGRIITQNGITYSEFENLPGGTYTKNAWEIDGYVYLGYIIRDDFKIPNAPLGVADTADSATVTLDSIGNNRKQIIFVYEKDNSVKISETRLSICKIKEGSSQMMYTGSYEIDSKNILHINLYDNNLNNKYNLNIDFNFEAGHEINAKNIENILKILNLKYVGGLVKRHSEYFLPYLGEELTIKNEILYNVKETKQDKVHVIIGYEEVSVAPETEGNPMLKISYIDEKGNEIPNKKSLETKENIGVDILSKAEDFRSENYMYCGYTYVDTSNEFGKFSAPISLTDRGESVTTRFEQNDARRHIAFVYKKIELKFAVDVQMLVNDLENQLIGQKTNEDYWVLDERGNVRLKLYVSGNEGLNITNYLVKLRIPFDTYVNANLVKGGTINNLAVRDISNIIVADNLLVPIWVEEKEYDIDVSIEANVEGFGVVRANTKDNVEVVGRLYDFTVTNIDGSELTGDEVWRKAIFSSDEEYKAQSLPIGQKSSAITKYDYGIKLGTSFYYSVNTKGIKNSSISITPRFIYVSKDGKVVQEADVYVNNNKKWCNMLSEDSVKSYMSIKDENVMKSNVVKELEKAQLINKISNRYNHLYASSTLIGSLARVHISNNLSLPHLGYIDEIKSILGSASIPMTEEQLLTYASHWYGRYVVPSSSIIVEKGSTNLNSSYKDGYLVVLFNIISLDEKGGEYLSYDLPMNSTQWQKEQLNQLIILPNGKEVVINSMKDGYAPVIVYDISLSTKDNITSAGTH